VINRQLAHQSGVGQFGFVNFEGLIAKPNPPPLRSVIPLTLFPSPKISIPKIGIIQKLISKSGKLKAPKIFHPKTTTSPRDHHNFTTKTPHKNAVEISNPHEKRQ
jgi:hypothetical protein